METAGLVIYISLANNLAERKMGATMGKEALGSLKNLPTKMTCTLAKATRQTSLANIQDIG